ncbi:MAG: hypothetical protein OXC40_07935 [Proteobacteria bacterium]|nr:hypothetical protein [Pseudomonadota bacterium]
MSKVKQVKKAENITQNKAVKAKNLRGGASSACGYSVTSFKGVKAAVAAVNGALYPSRVEEEEGPTIKKLTPSAKREIELKNHARKLAGLSPIIVKVRKCISCGQMFESSGNRNCGCQSRRSGFIAGREII